MKKSIVLFTLCVTGVLSAMMTEEQKNQIKPVKDACIAETGVMEADVDESDNSRTYPADGKLDCFSACMFKRMEVMSEAGELDMDMVNAILSERISADKLNEAVETCTSKKGKDACETAGMFIRCFMKYED